MEKEPEFEEGYVAITGSAPHYWSRLGSAKSQSSEQQRQGKELVLDMTMETPEDGSCRPCGAAGNNSQIRTQSPYQETVSIFRRQNMFKNSYIPPKIDVPRSGECLPFWRQTNPSLLWLPTHKGSNSRQSKIIEGYLMSEQSRIRDKHVSDSGVILPIGRQYEKMSYVRHFQDCPAHFTSKKCMLKQVGKTPVHQDLNLIHCIKEIHRCD